MGIGQFSSLSWFLFQSLRNLQQHFCSPALFLSCVFWRVMSNEWRVMDEWKVTTNDFLFLQTIRRYFSLLWPFLRFPFPFTLLLSSALYARVFWCIYLPGWGWYTSQLSGEGGRKGGYQLSDRFVSRLGGIVPPSHFSCRRNCHGMPSCSKCSSWWTVTSFPLPSSFFIFRSFSLFLILLFGWMHHWMSLPFPALQFVRSNRATTLLSENSRAIRSSVSPKTAGKSLSCEFSSLISWGRGCKQRYWQCQVL